jgi:hypothetical protein
MPAVSEKQRQMMAIAKHSPSKLFKRNRNVLQMTAEQISDFTKLSSSRNILAKRRK